MEHLSEIPKKSKRWRTLFMDADACTMFQQEQDSVTAIVTFCQELDNLLGGGVHLGHMTEIASPAGIGKTQMCFQLAVDVQVPKCFGGVQGTAIYIDTENSFNTKRLKQITEAAIAHCHKYAATDAEKTVAENFTCEKIFSNILFKKCRDSDELLKIAESLEEFVRCNDQIKLVIVDSVAFPFRYDDREALNPISRFQLQQRLKLALLRVAVHRNIAVVLTNHVTTKFTDQQIGYESTALGANWGCDCATRLYFSLIDNHRVAVLIKSSRKSKGFVHFRVESEGIRDDKTKTAADSKIASNLRDQIIDFLQSQTQQDNNVLEELDHLSIVGDQEDCI